MTHLSCPELAQTFHLVWEINFLLLKYYLSLFNLLSLQMLSLVPERFFMFYWNLYIPMLLFLKLSLFSSGLVSCAPLLRALLDFLGIMVLFSLVCSLGSMPATSGGCLFPYQGPIINTIILQYSHIFPSQGKRKNSVHLHNFPLSSSQVPVPGYLLVPRYWYLLRITEGAV